VIDDIRRMMGRELEAFAREVELFPDDSSLWRTLPGVTNSAGNLALHVCGNLRHFVGAVLGGTGYVRDRPAEFATRAGRRADVARQLRETAEVVAGALTRVPESALATPYPEPHDGVQLPCGRFLMHLCVHLAFHLGQAGYLRRALTGDARTSGAISLKALAGD
jgi:uncharacterized damage-inducible protein DinB